MYSAGNGPANNYHQSSIDDIQFLKFDARRAINYKVAILDQFDLNVLHLDGFISRLTLTLVQVLPYIIILIVFSLIWTNLVRLFRFEISQYMLCLQNWLFNKDVMSVYSSLNTRKQYVVHPGNSSHWYPYQVLPTYLPWTQPIDSPSPHFQLSYPLHNIKTWVNACLMLFFFHKICS